MTSRYAADPSTPVEEPLGTPQAEDITASLCVWTVLSHLLVDLWEPAFLDAGDGEELWHWVTPEPVPAGHPPVVVLATSDEAAVLEALLGGSGDAGAHDDTRSEVRQ